MTLNVKINTFYLKIRTECENYELTLNYNFLSGFYFFLYGGIEGLVSLRLLVSQ